MASPKANRLPTLLLLFTLITLAFSASSPHQTLTENYDDGSEMNRQIIRDYIQGEECVRRCRSFSEGALLDSFEAFRTAWVEQMINFVIGELDLDAESARSIRKNPGSYMINYDTFKLLAFR